MKNKKYRIHHYGLAWHIFDVEVKTWHGWVLVKRYKVDLPNKEISSFEDEIFREIDRMKREAESLIEKLEEEFN